GMATVWKARQISLDRTVAIKILSSKFAADSSGINQFQSEAQAAAKLKHPGIVQVYDASAQAGNYYFVMEYIAGYTVGDWVRRKGRLHEKEVLLVAECVADALEYAWDTERIVHCDIKPDNVMVDSDGTVKVADLGLARSISAVKAGEVSEEIMGTPAFMSPEQCRGEADIDCRADMYSLGAMLYYLLTGKLLFDGEKEDRVIELQESGSVSDIIEENPSVSHGLCWFVEKLLAKNRSGRHKDWQAVKKDIARVKRGHGPVAPYPPERQSTLERSPARKKLQQARSMYIDRPEAEPSIVPRIIIGAGLAAIVVLGVILISMQNSAKVRRRRPPVKRQRMVTPATLPGGATEDTEKNEREILEFVDKWAREHPGEIDEAIRKYQKVVEQTRGTKYALMAEDRIRDLAEKQSRKIRAVMGRLDEAAEKYVQKRSYNEAASVYTQYSGEYADETKKMRLAKAHKLKEKAGALLEHQKRIREKKVAMAHTLLKQAAAEVANEGLEAAAAALDEGIEKENLDQYEERLTEVQRIFDEALKMDNRILDSFIRQQGKTISVSLKEGNANVLILKVADDKVYCRQRLDAGASRRISFGIEDLSIMEKVNRMGQSDEPPVCLVKGIMALRMGSFEHARRFFQLVHPLLSEKLLANVDRLAGGIRDSEAEKALFMLVGSIGFFPAEFDSSAWTQRISSVDVDAGQLESVKKKVSSYRERYGDTDFASEAEGVLDALENLSPRSGSGNEAGLGVSLPDDLKRIENDRDAVIALLLERNRELDENSVRINEGASVRHVTIRSPALEDIYPLAAFTELERLFCESYHGKGKLRDIGPVKYMANLRELRVIGFPVADITPLENLPLERLTLARTAVRQVSSLSGLKLSMLDLSATRVYDFSAIEDQPLRDLKLNNTQVKDVSFIEGMPLSRLELRGTRVYDFSNIGEMPLSYLDLSGTQVRDVAFLSGMPLTELVLNNTSVVDLSPISNLRLRRLDISKTLVKDFSPLKTMPVKNLDVSGGRIRDLSDLKNVPLDRLNISGTKVRELDPLEGKKISRLDISHTNVSDLNPLKGMPLVDFRCRGIRTRDFSALKGAPIKLISMDKPREAVGFLSALPNLKRVNQFHIVENMPIAPQLVPPQK
ncbi:MAG: protein kinase domain-containing protein, partial [Verrucomicrobiota bacterium]